MTHAHASTTLLLNAPKKKAPAQPRRLFLCAGTCRCLGEAFDATTPSAATREPSTDDA